MAATIKDIARTLGLSVSTVSYALNGGPKPVSEEVRAEVARVAKELGYQPNRVARSLVTRRSGAIGIVLPMVEQDALLRPFIQLALNEIINVAEQVGYDLVLLTGAERTKPEGLQSLLQDSRIDGLVLVAPPEDEVLVRLLRKSKMPFAIVAGGDEAPGPFYLADDEHGIRLAMEHLWSLGHRRIAHLQGRPSLRDARLRRRVYETFLRDRGVEIPAGYVQCGMYRRDVAETTLDLFLALPKPPTAILCGNDEMAIGLVIAARKRGLHLPEELSLVGYDDTDPAATIEPPLTTVRQPIERMAEHAFHDVLNQLKGQPMGGGTILETTLSVRGSTGVPMEDIIDAIQSPSIYAH